MCVCVCVCVYPGYIQSAGWDGRTLTLMTVSDVRQTVLVPPQHKVMLSFKDVHTKGTATDWCSCEPGSVMVLATHAWGSKLIEACEFILLKPVLAAIDQDQALARMVVRMVNRPGECPNQSRVGGRGEKVRVFNCLFIYVRFDDEWYCCYVQKDNGGGRRGGTEQKENEERVNERNGRRMRGVEGRDRANK